MNIGETKIATLVPIGQLLEIDSKQMQARCVKVIDMHFILRDTESQVARRTPGETAIQSTSGHPNAEAFLIAITSRSSLGTRSSVIVLNHRSSPKLANPNDKGIFHQSPLP